MKKRYWIIAIAALAFVGLGGWWYVTASTNTTTSSQLQKSSKSSSKTSKATPSTKRARTHLPKTAQQVLPLLALIQRVNQNLRLLQSCPIRLLVNHRPTATNLNPLV
ncbi:hypothetical protein U7537_00030 [Lacticaseibacillus rhamnosus]